MAASCQVSTPADVSEAQLGIHSVQIDERGSDLTIVGLGADEAEIGRAELSVGSFDFTMEDAGIVFGRQLDVTVHGRTVKHQSQGLAPLHLPLAGRAPSIAAFLREPIVAAELAARGVEFDHTGSPPIGSVLESPYEAQHYYSGTAYLGAVTHTGCTNSSNAKFEHGPAGGQIGEYRCCTNGNAAERRCMASAGAGQSTACGLTGANGCAVCLIEDLWDTCTANNASGQGHMYIFWAGNN